MGRGLALEKRPVSVSLQMMISRQSISRMRLCFLYLTVLCPHLSAATIAFTAVADTSLFEANPDYNLGATSLVSGTNRQYSRSRALFRFDLSALPAGAVVTNVQVVMNVTRRPDPDNGEPVNSDFNLYRLHVGWGEGTSSSVTGSVASPGDATWNERYYQTVPWETGGAAVGVDYAASPSSTTPVSGVGSYTWQSSLRMVQDVTAWQSDPASNFGFILISQDEELPSSGRRFASTEDFSDTALPPQLIVTYVPEPGVACLWLVGLAGAVFLRLR